MSKQTNKYPMALYKTPAAEISYSELRRVVNKSVAYARVHFLSARECLPANTALPTGRVQTLAYVKKYKLAIDVVARASQRLYDALSLKRALDQLYGTLKRMEDQEGARSASVVRAIDFSMRSQRVPHFLAQVTLIEWGFHNQLGEHTDFPDGALAVLSGEVANHPLAPCVAADTMVRLEDGSVMPIHEIPVGSRVLGSSVQMVKSAHAVKTQKISRSSAQTSSR